MGESIPAFSTNHLVFWDFGLSIGRPYTRSHTNWAKTPKARETAKRTV